MDYWKFRKKERFLVNRWNLELCLVNWQFSTTAQEQPLWKVSALLCSKYNHECFIHLYLAFYRANSLESTIHVPLISIDLKAMILQNIAIEKVSFVRILSEILQHLVRNTVPIWEFLRWKMTPSCYEITPPHPVQAPGFLCVLTIKTGKNCVGI